MSIPFVFKNIVRYDKTAGIFVIRFGKKLQKYSKTLAKLPKK